MARRPEVEVFGMSMMDTVTCGLGAAIILMLLIASMIPQRAQILFTHQEVVAPSDDPGAPVANNTASESRKNAIGILSLIYTNPNRDVPLTAANAPQVTGYALNSQNGRTTCTSREVKNPKHLRILTLADPEETFTDERSRTISHVFWWVGDEASMEANVGCLEIKLPQIGRSCSLRIIADAQQRTSKFCRDKLFFKRSIEGIYELEPGP